MMTSKGEGLLAAEEGELNRDETARARSLYIAYGVVLAGNVGAFLLVFLLSWWYRQPEPPRDAPPPPQPPNLTHLDVLRKSLEHADLFLAATYSLGELGATAKEARQDLTRYVNSEKWEVSLPAALALVKIDPNDAQAVPGLLSVFHSVERNGAGFDEKEKTELVKRALERWARGSDASFADLEASVSENRYLGFALSAQALQRIGPPGKKVAADGLTLALKNTDRYVRSFAAWALMKLDPDSSDAVTQFTNDLTDPFFVKVLNRTNHHAKSALPRLIIMLREADGDEDISNIAKAIVRIDRDATDAISKLEDDLSQLQSSDGSIKELDEEKRLALLRRTRLPFLRMGALGRPAIDPLVHFLKDNNRSSYFRAQAAETLARIGRDSEVVTSGLREVIDQLVGTAQLRDLVGAPELGAVPFQGFVRALRAAGNGDFDEDEDLEKARQTLGPLLKVLGSTSNRLHVDQTLPPFLKTLGSTPKRLFLESVISCLGRVGSRDQIAALTLASLARISILEKEYFVSNLGPQEFIMVDWDNPLPPSMASYAVVMRTFEAINDFDSSMRSYAAPVLEQYFFPFPRAREIQYEDVLAAIGLCRLEIPLDPRQQEIVADVLKDRSFREASGGRIIDKPDAVLAFGSLGRMGASVLAEALDRMVESASFRQPIAEALGKIGPPADYAVFPLIRSFRWFTERDGQQPNETEYRPDLALVKVLPNRVDYLIPELGKHGVHFLATCSTLGEYRVKAAEVVPILRQILREKDRPPSERLGVVKALGRIGGKARDSISEILQAYSEDRSFTIFRSTFVTALKEIGRSAIPELRAALKNPDVRTRAIAIDALGEMNTAAHDALPDLVEAWSREKDVTLRRAIVLALGKIARPPDLRRAFPFYLF